MDLEHQYDPKLGFERKIQDQRDQLRKLIFQLNNLSEHLGTLVTNSFQTKMGEEQRLTLANILKSHPDIAERVATHIEQTTLNEKKKILHQPEQCSLRTWGTETLQVLTWKKMGNSHGQTFSVQEI